MRLLLLFIILGVTHGAFGHPAAISGEYDACEISSGSSPSPAICADICLGEETGHLAGSNATCEALWPNAFPSECTDASCEVTQSGIFDNFNDNEVFIPIDNSIFAPELDLCEGRESCNQEITDSGNSSQRASDSFNSAGGAGGSASQGSQTNSLGGIGNGDENFSPHASNDGSGNSENDNRSDAHASMENSGNSENTNTASSDDSGNSSVSIDQSDNSVNDNSSVQIVENQYRAPALSTQLNVTTSHCINFIGIQFSGAKSNGAAAMGLGIPMRDQECRLEKAAVLAFQMENYEAGWTAYCSQKSVRSAWKARGKAEQIGRKDRASWALSSCMQTGIDVQETLQSIHDELELLRKELVIIENTNSDSAALKRRIRVLEGVAHNPNESFLLQRIEE